MFLRAFDGGWYPNAHFESVRGEGRKGEKNEKGKVPTIIIEYNVWYITPYVVLVAANNRNVDEAGDAERLGSVSLICYRLCCWLVWKRHMVWCVTILVAYNGMDIARKWKD